MPPAAEYIYSISQTTAASINNISNLVARFAYIFYKRLNLMQIYLKAFSDDIMSFRFDILMNSTVSHLQYVKGGSAKCVS
jgi:hypothetical protein